MRIYVLLVLCLLTVPTTVVTKTPISKREYGSVVVDRVISVYDGDTFRVDIAGLHPIISNEISIRVNGVDTPEIRGDDQCARLLARNAKKFTKELLMGSEVVELHNLKRGKYFRIVADVSVDGIDLGGALVAAGLARSYYGGKKKKWTCGH